MSSFGDGDIVIESYICGSFRLSNIFAPNSLYPRLGLEVECILNTLDGTDSGTPKGLRAFELRELSGILRLTKGDAIIGPVAWAGARQHVRSNKHVRGSHLRLSCDLDATRLEKIEADRSGELLVTLELWPTLYSDGFVDVGPCEIRARIPRDRWIDVLQQIRPTSIEVLEFSMGAENAEQAQEAIDFIRSARSRLDSGDFGGAVVTGRKALDSARRGLPREGREDPLATLFQARLSKRKAEAASAILSRTKDLAGYEAHADAKFSRAEAVFVLRNVESILALVSSLTISDN